MTINQYNKRLAIIDHAIITFNVTSKPAYSLVKLDPNARWIDRMMKINIEDTIETSSDFRKIFKKADTIIAGYGSGIVGAK